MSILGKPQGIFDLTDSNKSVGSFLMKQDICEILNVTEKDLADLDFVKKDGIEAIDERKVQKAWYDKKIPNAIPVNKSSLDELLLTSLIRKTLPNCEIERQLKIGRFKLDLKLSFNGLTKFVEFDGPSHFAITRYGPPKHEPFRKKKIIEDKTGIEVVNWAYWIQRCSSNVKAIFDSEINGLGVLWSTNIHFGDFYFENSAEIITNICKRFNCIDDFGVGYFYEENSKGRNNPEHPIISKILNDEQDINRLLPKGYKDKNFWLPKKLR